jgi:O-glycosyl hydrolase
MTILRKFDSSTAAADAIDTLNQILPGRGLIGDTPVAQRTPINLSPTITDATMTAFAPLAGLPGATIYVDGTETYQQMHGAGASLTESSCYVLQTYCTPAQRKANLTTAFGTDGFSTCRICIGASDFTHRGQNGYYTYCDDWDGPDVTMPTFTIQKDREYIIPTLREALAINPKLKFIASPWTPPASMKSTNSLIGRPNGVTSLFVGNTTNYTAYANYFVKFLKAYAELGIPIWAVTTQNEAGYGPPSYPGCVWTGAQMAAFVNILKPALNAAGFGHVKVLVGDHNWHNLSNYTGANGGHLVRDVFAEALAGDWVDGAAVHGYSTTGKNEFEQVRSWSRNAKETHFTEMCLVGNLSNKVSLQQHLANAIIGGIRAGQNSVTFWNLFLQPLSGGRYQPFAPSYAQVAPCATISTDGNGTMVKRPEYMALVHLLKVMKPGARRCYSTTIGVGEASLEVQNVAFANRDGTTGVLLYNNADTAKSISLIDGPSGLVSFLTLASGDIVSVNYTAPKGVPATGTVSAPGPVTGLGASSANNANTLAWTAGTVPDAGGLGGYLIKRGATAGEVNLVVGAAGPGETSFVDIDVVAGTNYFYQVFPLSAGGLATSSPVTSTTTVGASSAVPGAPAISVTPGNGQNVVALASVPADNGSAITRYNLYRSTTSGGQGTTPTVPGVTLPYTDTGLTNGTPYYYTLAAVNGIGQGPQGVEKSGIPSVASANVKPGPGILLSDDTGQAVQTARGGNPQGWSNTSFTFSPATSVSSQRNAVVGPDGVTKDASTQTFTNTGATGGYGSVECGSTVFVSASPISASIWLRGKVGGELVVLTLMTEKHANTSTAAVTLTTEWARYTVNHPTPTSGTGAILSVAYRPNTFNGSMSFDSAWPTMAQ